MKFTPIIVFLTDFYEIQESDEKVATAYKQQHDNTTAYIKKYLFDDLLIENYALKEKIEQYRKLVTGELK